MEQFSVSIFDKINGTDGDDSLTGTSGNDKIMGLEGDDTAYAGAGNDRIYGYEGSDSLHGEDGNDTIDSGNGDDLLFGGSGDDLLKGGHASFFENLFGGDGNDELIAGICGFAVVLDGGAGDDILNGKAGLAVASYGSATAGVTVSLENKVQNTGSTGVDTFLSIEGLIGSNFDDWLKAGRAGATIDGALGNDIIIGSRETDFLRGGLGSDSITGGHGTDLLDGGRGDDYIDGGSGEDTLLDNLDGVQIADTDTLRGGTGNDSLFSGLGGDILTGGAGSDVFWYTDANHSTVATPDLITDLSDQDTIRLTEVDGGGFNIVSKFTGKAHQLTLIYDAHDDITRLAIDLDGNKHADMEIDISGDHHTFESFTM